MSDAALDAERLDKLRSMHQDRMDVEFGRLKEVLAARGLPSAEAARVERAFAFARAQDYGPRPRDRQYASHAARVARGVAGWAPVLTGDAVVACLVHNAFEKGISTPAALAAEHGAWVADAVSRLTVDREAMKSEAGKRAYYEALGKAEPAVRAIKVFDKHDNLLGLCANPDAAVRERYLAEAEAFVVPLAAAFMPAFVPRLEAVIADDRRIGHFLPEVL